jgi:hypothetical protein
MRRPVLVVLLIGLTLLLTACPSSGGKTPAPEAPPAPSGLTAVAGNASVVLSWKAASDDGITRYNIYQGTASGGLTKVGSVAAGVLSYTAVSLTNGTEYFFAVDAETTGGKLSAKSNEVSAIPSASPAGTPFVTAITPADGTSDVGIDSNINVSFSEAMNQAATEAAFSMEPAVACTFIWNADSTRLTCAHAADLTPETPYTVTIGADAEAQTGIRLAAARSATFTTGSMVAASCIFDTAKFDDGCVFAP